MIKNILLGTLIVISIIGCSDKEKEENKKEETKKENLQSKQENLKIEIEENNNKKEVKVAEKLKNGEKNESYYYDYNVKSENENSSIKEKPRSSLDANMQVRSPYEKIKVSMLVKKLSKEFIVKCSACHNDYANGIIGPSLLNKDAAFIFNQIKKFKNDVNANVLMTDLVKPMSDEEITKLSNEIYEFNRQIKEIK
jgi:cytochrome c553